MAAGSVADTTALLASWCERASSGLALVEFDSEPARQRVTDGLSSRLTADDVPFIELDLSDVGDPHELISRLHSLPAGAVSVSGFEALLPLGGSHGEMLAAFNFQRERLAEPPLRQIWWMSVRVAEDFLRGAPDLYSWFVVRLHLTEAIPPLSEARVPIESLVSDDFEGLPPTSLEDARQRASDLAARFERALDDPEEPLDKLARRFMEPAVRSLSEAGAAREAQELEGDLRQRARAKNRPFPPGIFVSYNRADRAWAEWIGWQLESAGQEVVIQAWDFRPGSNFVLEMNKAAAETDRTVAVLSQSYLDAEYTHPEWAAAFARDPQGNDRRLVPVRVAPCKLTGLLAQIVYIDLVDEDDEDSAREKLLEGILGGRGKPGRSPSFLGQQQSRPAFPGRRWNVPYRRNHYFTGREEEVAALRESFARVGIQAISGLGGVGKTQMAVEYAYRHRTEYRAVLWCRAETEAELVTGFAEIARVLELPEQDAREQSTAVAAVRRWLEREDGWLVVLDNADDPELVETFLPVTHRGHVLLTSRAWNLSRLKIARPVRLESLPREDAVAFLLTRVSREDVAESEKEAASEIAKELGDLPLALEQAAAYIHDRQARFDDYLASYRAQRLRLLERCEPADYPASVATTWALNFEEVERISKASAELLRLTAFLAPEAVPLELFTKGASELGPLLSGALAGADEDPLILDEILKPLTRFSLIERSVSERTYRIHQLVQEVVRDSLDEEDQKCWAERAVRGLNHAYPHPDFENWPLCERLQAHGLATLRWSEAFSLELRATGRLLNQVGLYAWQRARYSEAESLYQRSLAISEATLGREHPNFASVINNLGLVYHDQGRYSEAEPLYRQSLAIVEKARGPEHPDVARALNNLADIYSNLGCLAKVEPILDRSREIFERVFGPEDPEVARALNNLAGLYLRQERLAEAELLLQRSCEIWEKAQLTDHPDVASTLDNLAGLYFMQGRFAKAEPLLLRSLEILEKTLGSEHPRVDQTRENLAALLRQMGREAEASEMEAQRQARGG